MFPRYRLADLDDLPAIVDLYNSNIASRQVNADLQPVPWQSRLDWFRAHNPGKRPIWVIDPPASSANSVAAWLSFSDFLGRPAYDGTAELSLYVHEDWRRQGLGSYLLMEAIKAAPALGIHSLVGLIFGHNHPSLKLFGKAGFQQWAYLPGVAEMDKQRYDLAMLGLSLS